MAKLLVGQGELGRTWRSLNLPEFCSHCLDFDLSFCRDCQEAHGQDKTAVTDFLILFSLLR